MAKAIEQEMDSIKEIEKKIEKFSQLLDSLETAEDKKKLLWKEAYENALNDRENANILFTDLLIQAKGNAANHTMFGPILAKYLERLCRSNDQILKLAEIIAKEESKAIDPDSIFDKISE